MGDTWVIYHPKLKWFASNQQCQSITTRDWREAQQWSIREQAAAHAGVGEVVITLKGAKEMSDMPNANYPEPDPETPTQTPADSFTEQLAQEILDGSLLQKSIENGLRQGMAQTEPTTQPNIEAKYPLEEETIVMPQPLPQSQARGGIGPIQNNLIAMGMTLPEADAVVQDVMRLGQSDDLTDILGGITSKLDDAKQELYDLHSEVSDLDLGDLESSANGLSSEASDLSSRASDLESEVSDAAASLRDLTKKSKEVERTVQSAINDATDQLTQVRQNQEAILRIMQRAAVVEDPDVVRERNAQVALLLDTVDTLANCRVVDVFSKLETLETLSRRVRANMPKGV